MEDSGGVLTFDRDHQRQVIGRQLTDQPGHRHGVTFQFHRALKTIAALSSGQQKRLHDLCLEISASEAALRETATPYLTRCHTICQGLCCRNVPIADLVHHSDFVLLLTLAGELGDLAEDCLEKEDPLYPKDCIFLDNGVGPCIFPENARPQICITAFCTEVPAARPEIRRVKLKFFKLEWHLRIWRLKNTLSRASCFRFAKNDSRTEV